MEKRKPHYPLDDVKRLIGEGAYRITKSALSCAARDFGLTKAQDLTYYVLELEQADFYKSMTTIADSSLWQDVYRPWIVDELAYLKLQIQDEETVVISFKLLEED